jgi:hypothetical protein
LEPCAERVVVNETRCVPRPIAQEVAEQGAATDLWRGQLESTYPDEDVSDTVSGTCMRFYFICLGGGTETPCMTIQQSKDWQTKSDDPLRPKGYMCPCGTTYKTKYGIIVEIVTPGVDGILYCRAPVPDEHINDMRAMLHESKLKPMTPEALYQAVPACKPSITSLIVERKTDCHGNLCGNRRTFRSKKDYQDLPEFDWYEVFHISGYELPPRPPTKKQKREQYHQQWMAAAERGSSAST